MAAALTWITPQTYGCLSVIRKVRNKFAHNPFLSVRTGDSVAGLISAMPMDNVFRPISSREASLTAMQRFRAKVIVTTVAMINEMLVAPKAKSSAIAPFSPLRHKKGDKLPPPMWALWKHAAQLVFKISEIPTRI